MFRFFLVVLLAAAGVTTKTVAAAAAAAATPEMMYVGTTGAPLVEERGLQNKNKGNPEAANEFLGTWVEKGVEWIPPPCSPTPPATTTSILTDFQLACGNMAGDGQEQVEVNLFGPQYGQEASCVCDSVKSLIVCAYGDPYAGDGSSSFFVQEYFYWAFDGLFGQFQSVFICQFLCKDDSTGDCVGGDTTVYDSFCNQMGFFGLEQPTLCGVTFESSAFAGDCQDCQVCTAPNGNYGVESLSGCFTFRDGSTCAPDPFYYNPFPALRESVVVVPISLDAGVSGATVGGVIGGILFVLFGGVIYYFLHQGVPDKCPRLPCQKKKEETHVGIKEAKTMPSEPDERDDPTQTEERGE